MKNLNLPFGINTLTHGFWLDQALLHNLTPICLANEVKSLEVPFPCLKLGSPAVAINIFAQHAQIRAKSVCMFFGKGMPDPLKPEEASSAHELLAQAMDFAISIGAKKVVGPVGFAIGQPGSKEQVRDFLKSAVRYAEHKKLTLCLEYLRPKENLALPNAEDDAIWVVDQIGSPWLKVHYDTFHDHAFVKDPYKTLQKIGSRLGHVHISGSQRMTPGLDQIIWSRVAQGLAEVKYQGEVVLELFGENCRQEIPDIVDADFPSSLSTNTSVEVTRFILKKHGII